MRLCAAIAISVCIAVPDAMPPALWGLMLGLFLLAVTGLRTRQFLVRLAVINCFILFIWLVVPFSTPGETAWSCGILAASTEGIRLAALVTVKANAIFFVFTALVADMAPNDLGNALASLGLSPKLIHLFLFGFRFWPLLVSEWQRLATAARIRAFRAGTNRHSYNTIASMLGLLIIRSNWRAMRVREAMLLRGFSGNFHCDSRFRPGAADMIFGLTVAMALVPVFLLW